MSLLDQDEYWVMRDGVQIPLEEMDNEHRRNVLNLLMRRAAYQMKIYFLEESREMMAAPDEVYNQWAAESAVEIMDDPEEWMARRPLIRKLKRLIANADAIDGEVVPTRIRLVGPAMVELEA